MADISDNRHFRGRTKYHDIAPRENWQIGEGENTDDFMGNMLSLHLSFPLINFHLN